MKHKNFDKVYPYSYFIKRKTDGMKYVGVRYKNVDLNLTPEEDFGKVYFTSGRLKKYFKENPENYEIRLVHTFDDIDSMFEWGKRVVLRIVKYRDWANQGWGKNYGENPDIGKLISKGKRAVKSCGRTSIEIGAEKLKQFIWNTPEGEAYREDLSNRMKEYRASLAEDEVAEIQAKRKANMDFYAASSKASDTMRKDVDENGLNMLQRKAKKGWDTLKREGKASKLGEDRNTNFAKRLSEMSQEEFESFCEGYSEKAVKGFITKMNNYKKAHSK